MSEPKLISPLLDGFAMGAPMSSHDGVECCPAIRENSDKKYIVKVISVPASQVQMDALLLAGAYRDPEDAMNYFREVGSDVMKEAEFLQKLSTLDGFLSYDNWQMEPITSKRLGYQVYLVGSYKRSLEKYVRRNPVTHLEAMNLGLDLCSALSVCREAGALYVDLKPNNVFVSEKKEYRIGDLGFVQMDALKYTALPDKYRSVYTPPELHDPMATLNLTADTYAVGMILYQLYNEGQLPFREKAPEEVLPSPANADYELAEIIMKAIHPDPAQRWQDPKDLGKALAEYMQRNVVNDTPITPYTALELGNAEPAVNAEEKVPAAVGARASSVEDTREEAASGEAVPADGNPEAPSVPPETDETLPSEGDADSLLPHEMSDELSRMMEKAEDLLSHETPEGVTVPEIPEKPDPFGFVAKNFDEIDDTDVPFDPVMNEERDRREEEKQRQKALKKAETQRRIKKLLTVVVVLLILALLGFGAFAYYQNVYLQTVDAIHVTGDRHQLTVTVDTQIDPALLTVICSDNYGNVETKPLNEAGVSFSDLLPNTIYRIELEMEGFHKLVGQTSDIFTTDTSTSIVSFTAVTGSVDGSVMLSFAVDGQEPEEWTVVYQAEGEEEQRQTFTGHSVTIHDLAVSKVYTFTLEAGEDLSLGGTTSLNFMASRLILAQDLTITSTGMSDMTVHWNAPGDIVVDSWNVRCYNDAGYEEQRTVTDTEVSFTGVDPNQSYTVEVTASGMTQAARTSITANPIHISDYHVEASDYEELTLSWEHTGAAPDGGWLVMYTIDGSESSSVIKSDSTSIVVSPQIPGADYQFTVYAADATSIFGNVYDYTCPEAPDFTYEEAGLAAQDMEAHLVKTPDQEGWQFDSMSEDDFTDQFQVGDGISVVLHGTTNFHLPGYELKILYVIEDAHGNVFPDLTSEDSDWWKELWYAGDYHYGELDVPTVPTNPGSYQLTVYFNGMKVTSLPFTITE